MRFLPALAVFSVVSFACLAQAQSSNVYRIHRLILTSTDLPAAECNAIIRAYQGGTHNLDDLAKRIRYRIRDDGYSLAEVGDAQIMHLRTARRAAGVDVRYSVHAGSRFRLSEITFHLRPGEHIFNSTQLRAQFSIQDGAIFNDHQ